MSFTPRSPATTISAVVSDVDGTLVTSDKLTERTRAAVANLHARAFRLRSSAAGRRFGLRMLIEPLAITTPIAGFNSGLLTTPDLSPLIAHALSPAAARQAVAMIEAHDAQAWIFGGQDWLLRDPEAPYVGREEHTIGYRPTVVQDFGRALDGAGKIVGVSADFDLLARLEQQARAALAEPARSPVRNPTISTSPIRSPTKASVYPSSRSCWRSRSTRLRSSAMAPTMSRCSRAPAFPSPWATPARKCRPRRIS
jgi:hypothetical protein